MSACIVSSDGFVPAGQYFIAGDWGLTSFAKGHGTVDATSAGAKRSRGARIEAVEICFPGCMAVGELEGEGVNVG